MIPKNSINILLIFMLVLVFNIPIIHAIKMPMWTIVSSGGISSSDNYTVDLTIGDNIVGTATSTSYTLEIGFLSIYSFDLAPANDEHLDVHNPPANTPSPPVDIPNTPSGSGGSGGGGGGGGSIYGGSGDSIGDKNLNPQLYEISWNLCDSNIIEILAGPASDDLYVTIRTAQFGIVVANLASEQPYEDILNFEANISHDESFVLVKAEFISGRYYDVDKQMTNLDSCEGRIVFQEYVPPESNVVDTIPIVFEKLIPESEIPIPAPFVDPMNDPQYYVDRYYNEPIYKMWFDKNYPEYSSIYHAVGLSESDSVLSTELESEIPVPAPFVDPMIDPQYYVDRYYDEPLYKMWFDKNYPEYSSIYHAVGLSESDSELPVPVPPESELIEINSQLIQYVFITIAIIIISFIVYYQIVYKSRVGIRGV